MNTQKKLYKDEQHPTLALDQFTLPLDQFTQKSRMRRNIMSSYSALDKPAGNNIYKSYGSPAERMGGMADRHGDMTCMICTR